MTTALRAKAPSERARDWVPLGLWGLALTVCVYRLAASAVIPLTEDEAYYREWALFPGVAYFDHPPVVAWWVAAGMRLFGDNAFGVRAVSVAASVLLVPIVFDTARLLTRDRVGAFRASLWLQSTAIFGACALLAAPDAPDVLFWSLSLWCIARQQTSQSDLWWFALGVCAALASLSKIDGLFIAPGVFLWLLSSPRGRERLASDGPWIAAACALLILAPFLIWNAEHDWLTFSRQLGRVKGKGFAPRYLAEFVGVVVLIWGPGVALLALRGIGRARRGDQIGDALRLCLLMSAPFAAYLAAHALHDRVQANWPAPLSSNVAIAAAMTAGALRAQRFWRWLAYITAPFGFAISALALLYLAIPDLDRFGASHATKELRGWPSFAAQIERTRQSAHANWIGALRYGTAAQLNFQYHSAHAVEQLDERQRYAFQPHGRAVNVNGPGLIVDLTRRAGEAKVRACFKSVRPLGVFVRGAGVRSAVDYAVYLVDMPTFAPQVGGCPAFEEPQD